MSVVKKKLQKAANWVLNYWLLCQYPIENARTNPYSKLKEIFERSETSIFADSSEKLKDTCCHLVSTITEEFWYKETYWNDKLIICPMNILLENSFTLITSHYCCSSVMSNRICNVSALNCLPFREKIIRTF